MKPADNSTSSPRPGRLLLLLKRVSAPTLLRFAVLSGANFASSFFGFVLVIVIIRVAGAEALGEFSFGLTVVGYALIVNTMGTEYHAIRLAAEPSARLPVLVPSVILLRLLLAVPTYGALVALALTGDHFAPYRASLLILGLSVVPNAGNLIWLLQAGDRHWAMALGNLTPSMVTVVFVLCAASLGLGVSAFAVGKVTADIAAVVLLGAIVRKQLRDLDWRAGWLSVWPLAKNSSPVGGSQMLRGLALSSDLIVLGFLVSPTEIGHYSAAFRVFGLLLSLGTVYHLILIPIFARHANRASLSRELVTAVRMTIAVSVPVFFLVCIPASFWMRIGFGRDFVSATLTLQLLACAALANILARPYRQVLLTNGRQKRDLHLNITSCVVHVALKPSLCLVWGASGVALGTLAGEAVLMLLTRHFALRAVATAPVADGSGA